MKDETPAPQLGLDAPFMNKVGRRKEKGESEDTTLPTSSFLPSPSPILDSFAKDTGPAAEAIKELLKTIESGGDAKAEAAALIEKPPDLMPEDPAMSAVIAEAMAAEFAASHPSQKSHPSQEQPISNSGTSEGARKGWETRRRNGWTPEQFAQNNATVEQLINDLDKRGPHNSKAWKNTPKDLGEVNESLAADIMAANPKMKVRVGTMQTIDQDQLNHAIEEHGEGNETWPNKIPITKDDLKKIPDVLSSYDEITPGTGKDEGKHQEAVIFRKRYEDGTICSVETDWFRRKDNRRELRFQTMWKEKPEEKK